LVLGHHHHGFGGPPSQARHQGSVMIIYGVALLAACLVAGLFLGELLGQLLGVQANVGGVGIAMLLLVLASGSRWLRPLVTGASGAGINFWGAMYIPIVVAMAASQNVAAAVNGGMLAVLAGVLAVLVSFALVPLINRIGPQSQPLPPLDEGKGTSNDPSA
jgi:malonate transporter MadL subunit